MRLSFNNCIRGRLQILTHARELKLDIVGGTPAVVGVFRKASFYDSLQRWRERGLKRGNRTRLTLQHRSNHARGILSFEGTLSGRHLI